MSAPVKPQPPGSGREGQSKPGTAPGTARQISGRAAEDRALQHLTRQGLVLVERNFLCRGGEIDLVMRDRDALVFVEVRQRGSSQYGGAAASVTAVKQARMRLAAQLYLQRKHATGAPPPCRFDVVAVDGNELNWLQNVMQD